MSYKFTIPGTDSGKESKFQQFRTGFAEYAEEMGYDTADVTALTSAVNAFTASLTASNLAKDAAQQAVSDKDKDLASADALVRLWAQAVKTNPLATSAMLAEMGIVPASAPAGPVTVPGGVAANASASGSCTLTWTANGNVSGTTYVIEASTDGASFAWLGSTTKRRFTDLSATPGVSRTYRVRAQRAGATSMPSMSATIYPGGEGFSLQEAA